MKKTIRKISSKTERGQAIILVALAMVGLIAMAGLVTDTGLLLINYGKLKRGVDAAAVAAAQQYREPVTGAGLDKPDLINTARNFLQLNETLGISDITVYSCEDAADVEPVLCNKTGNLNLERKLVQVDASTTVNFGFLSVIGIKSTTISATSVGEAAALDVVLIIDTSASMAYETEQPDGSSDPNPISDKFPITNAPDNTDNGGYCNNLGICQPMESVKAVAQSFINTLYFPYDRVGIITSTSITKGTTDWDLARSPVQVIPLTADKAQVVAAINSIRVFEPRDCVYDGDGNIDTSLPGNCRPATGSADMRTLCPWAQVQDPFNPTSCFSSNIGGALNRARSTLTASDGLSIEKLDAFWVVVAVLSGPANATSIPRFNDGSIDPANPQGYCPSSTWTATPKCRDRLPWTRHAINSTEYDPDDYARDQADALATLTTGDGVTIYTIGLGQQVISTEFVDATVGDDPPTPAAQGLFQYIAECAGEGDGDDCYTAVASPKINHGQYFFSPTAQGLSDIFKSIANNIATKISQ